MNEVIGPLLVALMLKIGGSNDYVGPLGDCGAAFCERLETTTALRSVPLQTYFTLKPKIWTRLLGNSG